MEYLSHQINEIVKIPENTVTPESFERRVVSDNYFHDCETAFKFEGDGKMTAIVPKNVANN